MIGLAKFLPILMMGGIGYHSSDAVKDRLANLTGMANKVVTRQRMMTIVNQATLAAASGDQPEFGSTEKFRGFVRRYARISGDDELDPSLDTWGRHFGHKYERGILLVVSAGPDKKFRTDDDIKVKKNIYNY